MIVDVAAYADGVRLPGEPDLAGALAALADGAFMWAGVRMPDAAELAAIAHSIGWSDVDVTDVLVTHTRPVLAIDSDVVKLVLRTVRYSETQEAVAFGEIIVLADAVRIVSVRYGQASPLAKLRSELEREPERMAGGTFAVLAAIVARVIDDYVPALDGFEHDVVETELEVFSDSRRRPIRRIYHLKRQVRELLIAIEALRDPLDRLVRVVGPRMPIEAHDGLHEASEALERAISRTRTLSDLLDAALDASLAQISIQQNDDMRRISAWVAIASGPTMVAGIYGMNFEQFPELHWRFGYPLVLGVMATFCITLFRVFRRAEWL